MDSGLQHEFVRIGGSDRVRKQGALLQHRRMIRREQERFVPMSARLESASNLHLAHRCSSRTMNASTLLGAISVNTWTKLVWPSGVTWITAKYRPGCRSPTSAGSGTGANRDRSEST